MLVSFAAAIKLLKVLRQRIARALWLGPIGKSFEDADRAVDDLGIHNGLIGDARPPPMII